MADCTSAPKAINDFVNTIRKCLNEDDAETALATITNQKDDPELQGCLSELIPMIVAHLNEDVQREKVSLFNCSEKLLNAIAEEYDPEDVLLQLIEDIEKAPDDSAFLSLLWPLQKVLLRLPKTRLNSLGWGLNAVHMYLNGLPLPENVNLDEGEEILMDADPAVEKISFLYLSLLPFFDTIIEDVVTSPNQSRERRIIILKFTLQLLGKPLAFLDLKSVGRTKSRARRVAESIIEKTLQIERDMFWFLELQNAETAYDIGQIDDLSLATLYYLILAEEVLIESVPKVYDQVYVFQYALHLATELFKYENQFLVHNGLRLAQVLMDGVEGLTLSYQLLDSSCHSKFCKALSHVIIYNPSFKGRQMALKIFKRYLYQFDTRGRYLLIYNILKVSNSVSVISYVVTVYKDMFMQECDKPTPLSVYFSGPKLFSILDIVCYLHKHEESDLVELSDQIVAVLNLLRYLAMFDTANISKVWDHFKVLEKNFLEPLAKGLMLSKAHYELKIKELKTKSAKGDNDDAEVTVTVAGQELSDMPTNEKLEMLRSAILTFEVISSLLARLNEVLETGRKKLEN